MRSTLTAAAWIAGSREVSATVGHRRQVKTTFVLTAHPTQKLVEVPMGASATAGATAPLPLEIQAMCVGSQEGRRPSRRRTHALEARFLEFTYRTRRSCVPSYRCAIRPGIRPRPSRGESRSYRMHRSVSRTCYCTLLHDHSCMLVMFRFSHPRYSYRSTRIGPKGPLDSGTTR